MVGRPTVFGKQIVQRNGEIIGINIGYNAFCEHEGNTLSLVQDLSNTFWLSRDSAKAIKKGGSILKRQSRILDKNGLGVFKDYRVNPNVCFKHRRIRVDRRPEEVNDGKLHMFEGGKEYDLCFISDYLQMERIEKNIGLRRVFYEDELLYLPDYQNMRFRPEMSGYIVGDWGLGYSSAGIMFAIRTDGFIDSKLLVDQVQYSLKSGYLALVNNTCGIFRDRGLGLVFLDKLVSLQEGMRR